MVEAARPSTRAIALSDRPSAFRPAIRSLSSTERWEYPDMATPFSPSSQTDTSFAHGVALHDVIHQALASHGRPEIFNTDQGSQFTSIEFIKVLKDAEIAISMDGKGAWRDNVFVERLWRTVKYEEVYLRAYVGVAAAGLSGISCAGGR